MTKYYIDSCIWIDYFEDRKDKFRPLGDWAFRLIKKIISKSDVIIFSNLVEKELAKFFSIEEIENITSIVPNENLTKVKSTTEQLNEARFYTKKSNIPQEDVLHAILARDNNAVLVTRDKHFYYLAEYITIKKPEELL